MTAMKNNNPPSHPLITALNDLWSDTSPRHGYERARAKYEALLAGIEAMIEAPTHPRAVLVDELSQWAQTVLGASYEHDFQDDACMVIRDTIDWLNGRGFLSLRTPPAAHKTNGEG